LYFWKIAASAEKTPAILAISLTIRIFALLLVTKLFLEKNNCYQSPKIGGSVERQVRVFT
jgi:hypothetical protein